MRLTSSFVLWCLLGALAACFFAPADAAAQQGSGDPDAQAITKATQVPTPRTADQHPDLTGFWGNPNHNGVPGLVTDGGKTIQLGVRDAALPRNADAAAPRRAANSNKPPYKPELLSKVQALAADAVDQDPAFTCDPHGIPRMGAPSEIIQTPAAIVFGYEVSENLTTFRIIPTDGRGHDEGLAPSYNGDGIGHWEGDTLVVDSTNFTDETWLDGNGTFHSDKMHVVERLTRRGDTLHWEATVEDPVIFSAPWHITPRTMLRGKTGEHVEEVPPCHDKDQSHMVTKGHL